MQERRQYPRFPVSCIVRLWFGDDAFAIAWATDASLHGVHVAVSPYISPCLEMGRPFRIDFHPGTGEEFSCAGDIRDIINKGHELEVRMYIEQSLPVNVLATVASAAADGT